MAPTQVDYVIFDVDGLLINTEPVIAKSTNDILAKYGGQLSWDVRASIMGNPARISAQRILTAFPDVPLTIDELIAQTDEGQVRLWHTANIFPGALRLVQHLHAHGVPIALATASRRFKFIAKAQHFPDLFNCFGDRMVCGDDFPGEVQGKPEPDLFLAAARERLGLKVGKGRSCTEEEVRVRAKGLVFEDAYSGLQGGKRAGMSVVWVPDPHIHDVEYSGVEQPDLTLKSLEEFVPEEWGLPPYESNT